jgi:hypothetical protein
MVRIKTAICRTGEVSSLNRLGQLELTPTSDEPMAVQRSDFGRLGSGQHLWVRYPRPHRPERSPSAGRSCPLVPQRMGTGGCSCWAPRRGGARAVAGGPDCRRVPLPTSGV